MASYFDLIKVAKTLGLQGHAMEEYISTQLARQQADKLANLEAAKIASDTAKEQTEAENRK